MQTRRPNRAIDSDTVPSRLRARYGARNRERLGGHDLTTACPGGSFHKPCSPDAARRNPGSGIPTKRFLNRLIVQHIYGTPPREIALCV